MDSMRSLNSSLPSSRSNAQTSPDLLQAFRTAALSVTNLYKSAAAEQASWRQAGYQDALEDLLKFLDEENLGVQDGEGWRIRQWATQHYDGGNYQQHSDEDDEIEHDTRQSSSSSTGKQQQDNIDASKSPSNDQETTLHDDDVSLPGRTIFQFTGTKEDESPMQTDVSSSVQPDDEPSSSSPPIRVEVLNRGKSLSNPSNTRHSNRSNHREFTFTAGTKRKLHFPDFFDISNESDRRDELGGSKRGRF